MTTSIAAISAASSATARATAATYPFPTLALRREALLCSQTPPPSLSMIRAGRRCRTRVICCEVALQPDSSISVDNDLSLEEDEELKTKLEKAGSRVRMKAPLKVHHVPRVPEVELTPGMEGVIKQYIGFWKGKRISANYPYKVEFVIDVQGRGPVKFFAHLKDDEFEFI